MNIKMLIVALHIASDLFLHIFFFAALSIMSKLHKFLLNLWMQ